MVWEDTDSSVKQYICALAIYLMTMLSSSYVIIMDYASNEPGHGKNVVDRLNETDKRYLKEEIEFIAELSSNDTSKIGIMPSASKYVSLKILDKCINILNGR